jgi:hypothetical protein
MSGKALTEVKEAGDNVCLKIFNLSFVINLN